MTKKLTLAITFLLLLSVTNIFACECKTSGDFLEIAPQSEMVAFIKVKKYLQIKNRYGFNSSIEIEIIEMYKGSETRKTVIVWGSTGKDCRPIILSFEIGKYYVMALYKGVSDGFEKSSDYTTSICGVHWLEANKKEQTAGGEKQNKISLADLKEKLRLK